ncbi:endoflagellar motor protein [Leptospira congkakensis]|uniref:Endoflagellar motor protein n=1 Tax=Leptospira congkakensis TaxID=2484932 RepID=A0A4Z1AH47_9LEPT|nr:flagellar motor protein MotB [Leptospira congkakensis]TGL90398.1 endoflagellar motor protein [Leptospira congkakensis]TGL91405.1 endoflagellar motor protein [Leptospira congkakensis]TGL98458.1 endoflagellar motor protein [Leptospira congkakensis]
MRSKFSSLKAFFLFGFVSVSSLSADWIYFPYEYNQIYKEKYALELELADIRKQHQNELNRLEEEKKDLQTQNRNLTEDLELEKRNRAKEQNEYSDKMRDYDMRLRSIEKKGTDKERLLADENRKREEKDRADLDAYKKKLEDKERECLQKEQKLRETYESKIDELKERIRNLEEELATLRKLTKEQKRELERLAEQTKEFEEKLAKEITSGQIRLKRFHNKLIINIDDKISFDSGSSELKPAILPAIEKIRDILASYPENYIIVEGHTDNVPIKTKFRNNWHLSSERALSVLEYMLQNKNLNPKNFSSAGYGEFQPIVPNSTKENKALNRRVDIVVVPRATGSLNTNND